MGLLAIPLEVYHLILTFLDVADIKTLHLTNRLLATISIGKRFLDFIPHQPMLDVTPEALRSLRALALNPALGKQVHALTFLATSFDASPLEKALEVGYRIHVESMGFFVRHLCTTEELSDMRAQVAWLEAQQMKRDAESPDDMIDLVESILKGFGGRLDAIKLDGAIIYGPRQREPTLKGEWTPLWSRASHVFYLILTAMGRSGISVKTLDLYRDTPRCCIPSNDITAYVSKLSSEQLKLLGGRIESLRLSISTEIEKDFSKIQAARAELEGVVRYQQASHPLSGCSTGQLSKNDPRATLADGTPGLAILLKNMPNLRRLNMHFRQVIKEGYMTSYGRILGAIAKEVQLPLLEECSLSGFLVSGEALLLFLTNHTQLRKLTLQECRLTSGRWAPIFAHLSEAMPALERLDLSNLLEKKGRGTESQANDDLEKVGYQGYYDKPGENSDDVMLNLKPTWDNSQDTDETATQMVGFFCLSRFQHHTRSFNRKELKKGLVFRPVPEWYALSSQRTQPHSLWYEQRKRTYGCPMGPYSPYGEEWA